MDAAGGSGHAGTPGSAEGWKVAVAGATGVVGQHVVTVLARRGRSVRPISRSRGVDLMDARQVERALRGVDVLVDVANVVTTRAGTATRFFERSTAHLLEGCRAHQVSRYVLLSIVGVDQVRDGYYAGKLRQEELVGESGLDHVVLRATQFHEFAGQMWDRMGWGPVVIAPDMLCAPVAAGEVAERLAELAVPGGATGVLEMGGPQVRRLPELMRAWGRAHGTHRLVVTTPVPGAGGAAMRSGGLLPGQPSWTAAEPYDRWLERTVAEQRLVAAVHPLPRTSTSGRNEA